MLLHKLLDTLYLIITESEVHQLVRLSIPNPSLLIALYARQVTQRSLFTCSVSELTAPVFVNNHLEGFCGKADFYQEQTIPTTASRPTPQKLQLPDPIDLQDSRTLVNAQGNNLLFWIRGCKYPRYSDSGNCNFS